LLQFIKRTRAELIVKCLDSGMKWAGSSFIVFLSQGVDTLLSFLSETKESSCTSSNSSTSTSSTSSSRGELAHDVDVYRLNSNTKSLGAQFVTNKWKLPTKPTKAGAVDKFSFTLVKPTNSLVPGTKFDVDQVNLYKSKFKMNPSGQTCVLGRPNRKSCKSKICFLIRVSP
jgi:hypothetical protein